VTHDDFAKWKFKLFAILALIFLKIPREKANNNKNKSTNDPAAVDLDCIHTNCSLNTVLIIQDNKTIELISTNMAYAAAESLSAFLTNLVGLAPPGLMMSMA
jgi:hypothetical protein